MKKIFISFLIMLSLYSLNFGQDVFRTGKNGIHLGAGYRNLGISAFGVNFAYERSIYKIPNIGYIGVGVFGEVIFPEGDMMPFGSLRGIYHAGFYRSRVLDVYAGLGACISPKEQEIFKPDVFIGLNYLPKHSKIGFFSEAAIYGANLKFGVCCIF